MLSLFLMEDPTPIDPPAVPETRDEEADSPAPGRAPSPAPEEQTPPPSEQETSADLPVPLPEQDAPAELSPVDPPTVPEARDEEADSPEGEVEETAHRSLLLRALCKTGLFFAGLATGVLFVCVYFGLIYLLFYRLVKGGTDHTTALNVLLALGILGTPVFFVVARLVRRIGMGRYAFPLGAFLMADGALVVTMLKDLLNTAKLAHYAHGDPALMKTYGLSVRNMTTALLILSFCWLISVLFSAFRYFQRMAPMIDTSKK